MARRATTYHHLTYTLGATPSELRRQWQADDDDNPFANKPVQDRFEAMRRSLDLPYQVRVQYEKANGKPGQRTLDVRVRVMTPQGKGTLWQVLPHQIAVQLDHDLEHVTFFRGEQMDQVQPIAERIYELGIFEQWVRNQ